MKKIYIIKIMRNAYITPYPREKQNHAFVFLTHLVIIISMRTIVLILIILLCSPLPSFAKKESKPVKNLPETGYRGTLPVIERYFDYKKQGTNYIPEEIKEAAPDANTLMKAPTGDDLFLDVIIKKEKHTPYVGDMLDIMGLFEKLRTLLLGDNIDIQKFNAQVNVIDLNVSTLVKKYSSSSYSASQSYIWCQRIAYSAKLLGNLMYDANYYSRYVPITDGQYSARNIKNEQAALVGELDKAIFTLRQLE